MDKLKIWTLAQEVTQALGRHYGPAMEKTAAGAGLEQPAWYLLLPTLLFEPDAVSAEKLGVRVPFNAAETYSQRLKSLAKTGLLQPINEHEYRLTQTGRQIIDQIVQAAYAVMADRKPMPESDLARLALMLQRLVAASEAAPEPPAKWGIYHSRRLKIPENAAHLIYIDQYLSDLSAYRDDAHLAAWQPSGLSAAAWEAFTLLWRGEVQTLDAFSTRLAHRGHGRSVYEEALAELIGRGWVVQHRENFQLTQEGQTVRQAAEQTTDSYFFAPWSILSDRELAVLEKLLERLRYSLEN